MTNPDHLTIAVGRVLSTAERDSEREYERAMKAIQEIISLADDLRTQLQFAADGRPYMRPEAFGPGQLAAEFARRGQEIAAGFAAVERHAVLRHLLTDDEGVVR